MEATAQLFYDMMDIVLGKVGKMNDKPQFSALSSAADWALGNVFKKISFAKCRGPGHSAMLFFKKTVFTKCHSLGHLATFFKKKISFAECRG